MRVDNIYLMICMSILVGKKMEYKKIKKFECGVRCNRAIKKPEIHKLPKSILEHSLNRNFRNIVILEKLKKWSVRKYSTLDVIFISWIKIGNNYITSISGNYA